MSPELELSDLERADLEKRVARLERRVARERSAREEAERIAEDLSLIHI